MGGGASRFIVLGDGEVTFEDGEGKALQYYREALAKQPYFKEIAQYHCELAQAALLKSDDAGRASMLVGGADILINFFATAGSTLS